MVTKSFMKSGFSPRFEPGHMDNTYIYSTFFFSAFRTSIMLGYQASYYMPACDDFTLEGIEKIKTEKKRKTSKQSEDYFFHQRCKKTSTNTVMASQF